MCDLNSVLLEGMVSGEPRVYEDGKRCSFSVSSWGRMFSGRQAEPKETRVWVILRGSSTIDGALKTVKDGCRVRIVGKLAGDSDGLDGIHIEAEHIEYQHERIHLPDGGGRQGTGGADGVPDARQAGGLDSRSRDEEGGIRNEN